MGSTALAATTTTSPPSHDQPTQPNSHHAAEQRALRKRRRLLRLRRPLLQGPVLLRRQLHLHRLQVLQEVEGEQLLPLPPRKRKDVRRMKAKPFKSSTL